MAKQSSAVETSERPYQKLMRDLASMATLDSASGDSLAFDIASRVIDQIAQADSLEAIFAANEAGPIKARDIVGQLLTMTDVQWMKTDPKYAENSLGVYAVLTVYSDRSSGEEIKVTTGAPQVVASIRAAQLQGYVTPENPLECRFTTTATPKGELLRLGRP